jgi:hypothetical protein
MSKHGGRCHFIVLACIQDEKAPRRSDICEKKLGEQSRLSRLSFEGVEVGFGIAAESGACGAGLPADVEVSAQGLPLLRIDPAEVASGGCFGTGTDAGDEPHRPPQHRARRGRLAPGGPPLVVALGAEQLFQGVVGARQVRHVGGVEQTWSIAARDLAEVVEGGAETFHPIPVAPHRPQQSVEALPDLGPRLIGRVGQEAGARVHEDEALAHRWPERGRAGECPLDQLLEPRERSRALRLGPPFERTRSRLPATFSNRLFKRSPAASSGARPSSVMALRIALA